VTVRDCVLTSDDDDEWFLTKNHATVTTDDHVYEVDGDVWSNIPLRNRREGMVTRITEGMTRWSCGELAGAGFRSISIRSSMVSRRDRRRYLSGYGPSSNRRSARSKSRICGS
jgi:hypothetical protein